MVVTFLTGILRSVVSIKYFVISNFQITLQLKVNFLAFTCILEVRFSKLLLGRLYNRVQSSMIGRMRRRNLNKHGHNQPRQCWIFYACYLVMAPCAVTSPINVGRATNTTPERGISPRLCLCRFEPPDTKLPRREVDIPAHYIDTFLTRTSKRSSAPDRFAAFLCPQFGIVTSVQRSGGEA